MSDRPVAFDVSRLVTRLAHPTPTGIDRLDLAYARWLLGGAGPHRAVISTALGPRVLPPRAAAALLAELDRRWPEGGEPEADPAYRAAAGRLGLPLSPPHPQPLRPPPRRRTVPGPARALRLAAGLLAGSRGIDALPRGAAYLHSSHLRLDRPERFAWLGARPDVGGVFFVHDLIPIDHPEFSRPGEDVRHRARLATVARHARGVIVNSAEVRDALLAHWSRPGGRADPSTLPKDVPVTVAPLGVEDPFRAAATAPGPTDCADAVRPFFVICGTIEPRKNHALLLQLWRRMAEGGGPVPKLVVAGRRGWESEGVIDVLERAPFVRDHVVEVSGLSTPALARLMGLARGLLMPSFAEGYGLPVAEALSLGTPVVASDIPVHREVAGPHAAFVDPLDEPGWLAAVRALAEGPRRRAGGGASPYRAPTWEDHLAIARIALEAAA